MKKIYIVLLIQMAIVINVFAQKPLRGCPKIIHNSSQMMDTFCNPNLKNVRIGSSNKIVIKYLNGDKQFISADSIWGFRQRNNNPHRYFNGDYYYLDRLSPVYKYSRRIGKHTNHYFSASLDSPIYPYYQDQLKKHTDSTTYAALVMESRTNRHELSFDFFAMKTSLFDNQLLGGGINVKYYPSKKWGTGLIVGGAGKKISDTFGFSITRPLLNYYEVGWINSYDLIQKNRWRAGIELTNGLAIAELRDKAQTEKVRTKYGYRDVPKKIASNYYYWLQPGIDFSVKVISNNHNPDAYLTGGAKYRLLFGKSRFGEKGILSDRIFSFGIALIGFDKVQLSK